MQEIRVDEALWASSMLPEGTVVRWLVADGAMVMAGKPIVEVRIEDALHEITAEAAARDVSATGRAWPSDPAILSAVESNANDGKPAHRYKHQAPHSHERQCNRSNRGMYVVLDDHLQAERDVEE